MAAVSDALVIGSGIAGLSFALKAAEAGCHVTVLTKRSIGESNTAQAQGGIASVLHSKDSFLSHIQDTKRAGVGLCRPEVVRSVVMEGPQAIGDLLRWGVRFSKSGREFDLTREGGHSARRVLHVADCTGREIIRALTARARRQPRLRLLEWHHAVDLITQPLQPGRLARGHRMRRREVRGAYALELKTGKVRTFLARATVLATGGAGKVYLYTSNPDLATGDGVAMAYRAGAKVANMEFFQFHPTCLYHPQAKSFLISEALRGEGAVLRDGSGRAFMELFHPLKELAPRDVVARAIDTVLKESGEDCAWLDITHKPAAWIRRRFPHIYRTCLRYGIDITRDRIPVVPAAHYLCGGVLVDLLGRTTLARLYAVGECACSGLHGANRLASNSLLESLVFGRRAAMDCAAQLLSLPLGWRAPHWKIYKAVDSNEAVVVAHNWEEIRRLMWNYVGIVRTDKRLQRALRRIRQLQKEIQAYYWDFLVTADLLELRNLATLAELIIRSAIRRQESRGLHYNLDHPRRDNRRFQRDTILWKRL